MLIIYITYSALAVSILLNFYLWQKLRFITLLYRSAVRAIRKINQGLRDRL